MSDDRTDNYVPDGLFLRGSPSYAEVGTPPTTEMVPVRLGDADKLNRTKQWFWADVSGDGTHYSRFNGHPVQIDVVFRTCNRRDVNDWKGRDEIRPGGSYSIALARQKCWEGYIGSDPLLALSEIPRTVRLLLDHSAIDWRSEKLAAEQLEGRRVYYDRTPAVVTGTFLLGQGCVLLRPVGVNQFPPPAYELDRPEEDAAFERDEIKTDILDPRIWWWRDREPGGSQRDQPDRVPFTTASELAQARLDGLIQEDQ